MITAGKELEAAGVLNGAQQRFEENGLWNMPVPFVAPDGALVPYAWKRQIAGQAAASAYDRARYAFSLLNFEMVHVSVQKVASMKSKKNGLAWHFG